MATQVYSPEILTSPTSVRPLPPNLSGFVAAANKNVTTNHRKTVDDPKTPTNDGLRNFVVSVLAIAFGLWLASTSTSTTYPNATARPDWNANFSLVPEFHQCERDVSGALEDVQHECLALRNPSVPPRTVSLPTGFGSSSNANLSTGHQGSWLGNPSQLNTRDVVLEANDPVFWELPPLASNESNGEFLDPLADEKADFLHDEKWRKELEEKLQKECHPKEDWMLPRNAPSTCNPLHELFSVDTTPSMRLLNCGTSHCALTMDDPRQWGPSQTEQSVVFKITMLDFDYDFGTDYVPTYDGDATEREKYEQSWKETIALERLQRSPYVLDIYGNCQQSQIAELAHDASITSIDNDSVGTAAIPPASGFQSYSLLDWINVQREYKDTYAPLIDAKTKLLVAYQIASAVADVHYGSCSNQDGHRDTAASINGNTIENAASTQPPSSSSYCMAHNDLFIHQFLFVNGRFKINDFNLANFARVRKDDPSLICLDTISELESAADKTKSPEELIRYWFNDDEEDDEEGEDNDSDEDEYGYNEWAGYEMTVDNPLLERNKVDVWYLGQAIYHVLTLHWMWENLPGVNNELRRWIMDGNTSPIPPRFRSRPNNDYFDEDDDYLDEDDINQEEDDDDDNDDKQYEQLLVDTIAKCWTYDPYQRPTSLEIRDYLKTNLLRLGVISSETSDIENDESWAKVRLPPIPTDYNHSEDDYNWSLYGVTGLTSGWFHPRSPELLAMKERIVGKMKNPPNEFSDTVFHGLGLDHPRHDAHHHHHHHRYPDHYN